PMARDRQSHFDTVTNWQRCRTPKDLKEHIPWLDRQQSRVVFGIQFVVWKYFIDVARAKMLLGQFAEDVAVVGGQHQVASFEKLFTCEAGPPAVNLAATDRAAEHHETGGVTVVRAA